MGHAGFCPSTVVMVKAFRLCPDARGTHIGALDPHFSAFLALIPGTPQWPFNGALMVLNSGYVGYIRG